MILDKAVALLKDITPVAIGVPAVSAGGEIFAMPSWLIQLGQAMIVAIFLIPAIDRRFKKLHDQVAQLSARVGELPCQKSHGKCHRDDCPLE